MKKILARIGVRMRERNVWAIAIVVVLILGYLAGTFVVPAKAYVYEGGFEIIVKTVYKPTPHPADDCQEDESWTAVHFETPEGIEDVHGVTRMCVPTDQVIIDGINELILDGWLNWAWDLPNAPQPWTNGKPNILGG